MKSRMKVAYLVALLTVVSILSSEAQKATYAPRSTPTYTPRSTPSYTPRPSVSPAPRSVPGSTPSQTQSRPATQHSTYTPPQHQTPTAPQHTSPSRPVTTSTNRPQTPEHSGNQTSHSNRQPKPAEPSHAQVQHQRKEAVRQQKVQARQQKEQAKQQQKQKKEQARQEKERLKREGKAKKEEARHSKGKPVEAAGANAETRPSMAQNRQAEKTGSTKATGPLSRENSESVLRELNSQRSRLAGANHRPLPSGDMTVHSNGRMTINSAGGRQYEVRSNGTLSSFRDSSRSASFNSKGKLSALHTASMDVRRGSHGQASIVSHREDGSTLVSTGRHSGFVERKVTINQQTYIQRTTVISQRVVTRNYVSFTYGGLPMTRFVTPVYFAPAFYGWAYYPWTAPIHFSFGWTAAPWYVGPSPYFTAFPEYPGAAYWLTDYAIGDTLTDSYDMNSDEMSDDSDYAADNNDASDIQSEQLSAQDTTPISPEIKEEIVEQVKQELSYDTAASRAGVQKTGYDEVFSVLDRPSQVFVVSTNMDVLTVNEQSCALQAGDILQMASRPGSEVELVNLRVASSRRTDCPAGVTVSVSLSDLQEMHNNFRARVEAGMGKLQSEQGHDGIPVAPAGIAVPPRPDVVDSSPISPSELDSAIAAQRQQANAAEEQVVDEAFAQGQ